MDINKKMLSHKILSKEEEIELIDKWQKNKDIKARNRLIEAHMRLCSNIVRHYENNIERRKDLIQEAVEALMTAIDKYDQKQNTRLATYARLWIMTTIAQKINTISNIVDMPSRLFLNNRSGEQEHENWEASGAAGNSISLDFNLGDDESGNNLFDITDSQCKTPEDILIEKGTDREIKSFLKKVISDSMSEREEYVLNARLLSKKPMTLEDIAKNLGISRERVRQVEHIAFRKIKDYVQSNNIQLREILTDDAHD